MILFKCYDKFEGLDCTIIFSKFNIMSTGMPYSSYHHISMFTEPEW